MDPSMFDAEGVVVKLLTMSFLKFGSYEPSVTFDPGKITTLSDPDVLTTEFVGVLPIAKYPLKVSKGDLLGENPDGQRGEIVAPPYSPVLVVPDREREAPIDPGRVSGTILRRLGMRLVVSKGAYISPEGADHVGTIAGTVEGGTVRV